MTSFRLTFNVPYLNYITYEMEDDYNNTFRKKIRKYNLYKFQQFKSVSNMSMREREKLRFY